MSADVMSRDVTRDGGMRAAGTRDDLPPAVVELLSGPPVRFFLKPLCPAIERVLDSLYWSTGIGRDRVSAQTLAFALVEDMNSAESVTTPMIGNRLSRMRNADYFWPSTLIEALEAEAQTRGWALTVLVEYLTARYVVGWAADLTRRDIEPLRVTG